MKKLIPVLAVAALGAFALAACGKKAEEAMENAPPADTGAIPDASATPAPDTVAPADPSATTPGTGQPMPTTPPTDTPPNSTTPPDTTGPAPQR